MSNYNSLKTTIDANIKQNGRQEITGQILNSVLNQMVTDLGAGYQFKGVATPTNPGSAQTPDYKCFYLATTPGTYTNLGGLVVADGEVAILKYDTSWTKEVTGAATAYQVSQLSQQVIYDVSENNDGATFASLSALLSSENLSTLIPIAVRCGGMSIRFVQTSDNKYVQYRYMGTATTGSPNPFLDTANWQGIDDEPIDKSNNLVKGGSLKTALRNAQGLFSVNYTLEHDTWPTDFIGTINIKSGQTFYLTISGTYEATRILIGGNASLSNVLADYVQKNTKYELTASVDTQEIWLYAQGVTSGNINITIAYNNTYEIEKLNSITTSLQSNLSETSKQTLPIVPLFDIKQNILDSYTPSVGYFIQPNGAKTANDGWQYTIIDVTPGKNYSISHGRHMTCYYDSQDEVVEGGSANSPDSEVRTIPSGVAKMAVSFEIASLPNMAVVESDTIVRVSQVGGYPSDVFHNEFIIEVGTNKQFTNVTDAFTLARQLPDKKVKILIYEGVYDIYNELGGDTFVINADPSATWNELQPPFVSDVEIIGVGDVTLKLLIPDNIFSDYSSIAAKLSIINNRANIVVDNINFEVKNCRYAIHDECDWSATWDKTTHIFKNLRITSIGRTCVGIGASSSQYIFNNCSFNNNDHNEDCVYLHTWPINKGTFIKFEDCVVSVGKLSLSVYNDTYKSNVDLNNSYFADGVTVRSETSDYNTNVFDIKTCNTNISSVNFSSSIISNPYSPQLYNW